MVSVPRFHEHYCKADRIMLSLVWLAFVTALGLASWYDTFGQALVVGGGTTLVLSVLYRRAGGSRLMRCCFAVGLMIMAALHINQAMGMIEIHFGIFVVLAVLTVYRDWLPLLIAALLIIAHHIAFHALHHAGFPVYVMHHAGGWGVVTVHAVYVVVETAILIYLARHNDAEATESQDMLDRILEAASRLAATNGTGEPRNRLHVPLAQRFESFLQQLTVLIDGVVRDTRGLGKLGNDLAQASGTLDDGARQQLAEISRMGDVMQRMGEGMGDIAIHVGQAVQQTGATREHIIAGQASLEQVQQRIRQLADALGKIDTTVQALASQAGKTRQGTELQAIVEALHDSRQGMQRCLQNSQRAATSLKAVAGGISTINEINDLIVATTDEHTCLGHTIARQLMAVQDIAEHTAENIGVLAQSSQRLPPLAMRLESLGQTFHR